MTRSWIGFIIPVVFYITFLYEISFEEKYLEQKFGEQYIRYKDNTGRIFPRLKNKRFAGREAQ
jgi:protein-S-isoprenylcysteine O-methyltransferase Ste14